MVGQMVIYTDSNMLDHIAIVVDDPGGEGDNVRLIYAVQHGPQEGAEVTWKFQTASRSQTGFPQQDHWRLP